jgi:hypothetical protein
VCGCHGVLAHSSFHMWNACESHASSFQVCLSCIAASGGLLQHAMMRMGESCVHCLNFVIWLLSVVSIIHLHVTDNNTLCLRAGKCW